jgi:hypothetical protein
MTCFDANKKRAIGGIFALGVLVLIDYDEFRRWNP